MKKLILLGIGALSVLSTQVSAMVEDSSPFAVYDTPTINENYNVYEYYRPSKMTPLIEQLVEYKVSGPGYICELRQPAPVYRFPVQYDREIGYREADWANNRIINSNQNPINFGSYSF